MAFLFKITVLGISFVGIEILEKFININSFNAETIMEYFLKNMNPKTLFTEAVNIIENSIVEDLINILRCYNRLKFL